MSLLLPCQLHWLSRAEGKNRAASHKKEHPRRYWKRVIPPLLLLIFLWGTLSASREQQKSQGLFTVTVSSSGLLRGSVYNLNQTGGSNIIREIAVTQGQYVRQGQVLARLDPTFLQRAVDAAQALVDVTQYRVNVSLARQARVIKEQQALVNLAETNFNVAQNVLQAVKQQAQANIKAAQVTLTTQKHLLTAVKQQAEAQIKVAQSQLDQSIASCRSPSPSGTSTPASRKTSNQTTTQTDAVQACIRRAQLQYQQVVKTAQTAIVTAQVQVTRYQREVADNEMVGIKAICNNALRFPLIEKSSESILVLDGYGKILI